MITRKYHLFVTTGKVMQPLQSAVKPYVGLFNDNPIKEAFRAELDSHPLLTSLFSENWELFEAVTSTSMLRNVVVQKGELLAETAAKAGIAKRYKNKAHLFSKKCHAGSLESYGQKYTSSYPKRHKKKALRLAYEQNVTLHSMHTQCGLGHLDYKAGNIMLDGDPKNISSLSTQLSDFGTASPILDEVAVECAATYPPPEMKYGGLAIPVNPAIVNSLHKEQCRANTSSF